MLWMYIGFLYLGLQTNLQSYLFYESYLLIGGL